MTLATNKPWRGMIGFGLLNIPVSLTRAVHESGVPLHEYVDTEDGLVPVKRQRVTPDGRIVAEHEVVKAYDTGRGHVVVDSTAVQACKPAKDNRLSLDGFCPLDDIPRGLYDKPYWILPETGGEEAYSILVAALRRAGMAATGTFVLRSRQYVVAVYPDGDLLAAHLLFWPADTSRPEVVLPKPKPAQVRAAVTLIQEVAGTWAPDQYHNTYQERLAELVESKMSETRQLAGKPEQEAAPVIDIVSALQQSMPKTRKKVPA